MFGPSDRRFDLNLGEEAVPSAPDNIWRPSFISPTGPLTAGDSVVKNDMTAAVVARNLVTPRYNRLLSKRFDELAVKDSLALSVQCAGSVSNMAQRLFARTRQVESLAAEVMSLKQEILGLKQENKQLHKLAHSYATNMKINQMQESDGQILLDHQRFVGLFQQHLPSSSGAVPRNEASNNQPSVPPSPGVPPSTEAPPDPCLEGTYQANRPEIDRRQGPKEAAGHQGNSEVCSGDRKSEEASPFQAGNGGPERDQEVPEKHRVPDPQDAIPKAGEGDRPGLQDRSEVPEQRHGGAPGGGGGVLGGTVRGHQPKQLLKSIEPLLKRKSPADDFWVRAKNEMMSVSLLSPCLSEPSLCSALVLFFFFNLYMYRETRARILIPAMSPATIPTMAVGLSPVWLCCECPFFDLGKLVYGFWELQQMPEENSETKHWGKRKSWRSCCNTGKRRTLTSPPSCS
ncbi:hypothetical protein EV2_003850 [Malus domestica]